MERYTTKPVEQDEPKTKKDKRQYVGRDIKVGAGDPDYTEIGFLVDDPREDLENTAE